MAVLLISTTYCKVKVATIIKSQKKKKMLLYNNFPINPKWQVITSVIVGLKK